MNFLDARLPSRFWDKVSPVPFAGCWLWTGATDEHGYAKFRLDGATRLGHRVSFAVENALDEALVLDHVVCNTPACVNPVHVKQVSQRANAQRNYRSTRTHCAAGHEFTDANTYKHARGRKCRRCHADRQAARKVRLNARAKEAK